MSSFRPCGHAELDHIRQNLETEKTCSGNYRMRVFLLKQWICRLQQMEADTSALLDVSEILKAVFPWNLFSTRGKKKELSPEEEQLLFPAVDEGYRILAKVYSGCNPLCDPC